MKHAVLDIRDRRPEANSGFTLMELVVVLTLLVVMSLTVTPVFRGSFASTRADHAMRDLFAAMKAAQADAITEAVEYRVLFDPANNRYWTEHAVHGEFGMPDFERVDRAEPDGVLLPDVVKMERPKARRGEDGGTYYVGFYPNGGCDVAEIEFGLSRDSSSRYLISATGTRVTFEAPST